MADNALKIEYKLYLEAEDVSQSRILSSASYLENVLHNHANPYIKCAQIDNETDCTNVDAAEAFLDEFADVLSEIAHIHSFMDMEGSFSVSFEGEHIAYDFRSEPGDGMCDFIERKEN